MRISAYCDLRRNLLPCSRVTIDEELTLLEDSIRKLKIEYDIYFNGGSPRPPFDHQWRVESTIKKYNDNTNRLSYGQRFRFNSIVQKYAIYNDLWRQRVKNKEEGREIRPRRDRAAEAAVAAGIRVEWRDPEAERDKVEQLFQALVEAKKKAGENTDTLSRDNFQRFVRSKTDQLKKDFRCESVEYVVEVEGGQVRLKARAGGSQSQQS